MTSFNAIVELDTSLGTDADDAIIDALIDYHPALAATPWGTVDAIITLPGEHLRQATTTALAVVSAAAPGVHVRSVRVMTTTDFDVRNGLEPDPADAVGVPEAARILGTSPQAVRQRLAAGSLPGTREGRDWRIPRVALEADRRDRLSKHRRVIF